MGILVEVYRNNLSDSSNYGMSYMHDTILVENVEGPFNNDGERQYPVALLQKGVFDDTVNLVPKDLIESSQHVMFGGNYASSSDSRFGQAIRDLIGVRSNIVAIFDRVENF